LVHRPSADVSRQCSPLTAAARWSTSVRPLLDQPALFGWVLSCQGGDVVCHKFLRLALTEHKTLVVAVDVGYMDTDMAVLVTAPTTAPKPSPRPLSTPSKPDSRKYSPTTFPGRCAPRSVLRSALFIVVDPASRVSHHLKRPGPRLTSDSSTPQGSA
jgi:hypothetical protein